MPRATLIGMIGRGLKNLAFRQSTFPAMDEPKAVFLCWIDDVGQIKVIYEGKDDHLFVLGIAQAAMNLNNVFSEEKAQDPRVRPNMLGTTVVRARG